MENTTSTKAGKGLGVAGFVIALVALVLWIFISGAAVLQAVGGGGMGLAIFWIIVSVSGIALSIIGFMKAKSGNGKKAYYAGIYHVLQRRSSGPYRCH